MLAEEGITMLKSFQTFGLAALIIIWALANPSSVRSQTASKPPDPGGWMAAKWGMTEKQVLAAFPDQARRLLHAEEYSGGSFASIVIDSIEIGVIAYRVHFIFRPSDSTLEAVNICPADNSAGICAAAYDHLEELLTNKYGAPRYRKDGDDARGTWLMISKILTWRLTTTEISLAYTHVVNTMPIVRLLYRPLKALEKTEDKF